MNSEKKKVLIVEDYEDSSLLAQKILSYYGFSIHAVSHGNEALKYCENHIPDLILMDLSLPVMDGWEVTRLLKSNGSTRHIPIIVLTAHALVSDREKAFEAGCDDYDTKPVEFGRLREKIENLLVARKLS